MPGNKWARLQEATGTMGEALMRVAMLSDDRRYRAEQLARQGRYDERAQQRIDMDEQMLAQSVARTAELTRAGSAQDARAGAEILRDRGREGYTPNLGEGGTQAAFLAGLGEGAPQQWDFDPAKSEAYLDRGAANTQALTQAAALAGQQTDILGTRAEDLGEQGYTVSGQPLDGTAMITMNGREFPDTPEGQSAALAWREQVEAVGGSPGLFDNPEVMEMMRDGQPDDEGGSFLGNLVGAFRGRGGAPPADTTGMMQQGAPADTTGMMQQGAPTPEQMEKMQELREQGFTEEQIEEWLRTLG